MPQPGALDGIKVVDLSRLLPGPYCSMILADHGARVIAIEDKRFAADGLYLETVNRNKEHMTLDLKTPEGKDIFFALAKDADVVLEGFRPGVTKRLGVDYEAVSAVNPGVVYCSVTGYGQEGPLRDVAGHDANYLSYSGVLDIIGEADRPPSIPGVQFADMAGGGMSAAIGILLALVARQKTGRGQYIDISMTDNMFAMHPVGLMFYQVLGVNPPRGESMLAHRYACYSTYATADGRAVSVGAVENRFWKRLCELLGVPEYASLQYDEGRRLEIKQRLAEIFATKTLAEWEKLLAAEDCCVAPVKTLAEALESDLFQQRDMVVEMTKKDGAKTKALGVPVKLSDTPGGLRTPPAAFGEHTKPLLAELGYSEAQIQELEKKGVI
ncbi:MAG: CoA transferase [Deltaproteobacteria bacterium]|nr:CoA transferase [Deltaproteobacteria bacterium]